MGLLHRQTIALSLYRYITRLSGPAVSVLLRHRLAKGKEDPERVAERRGIASVARPEGLLIWIHCASVGESLSVLPLINQLCTMRDGLNFLVTSGTVTSAQLMAQRLPPNTLHQFIPLDHPTYCQRFFDHWQPDLGVMIESELWPNLILGARQRDIPLVLVNARLSQASFDGWQKARKSIACLLNAFNLVLAQDEKSAERFRLLDAPNVSVPGNLKDDAVDLPFDSTALDEVTQEIAGRPCWVAASTHEGEEVMVAHAHTIIRRQISDVLTIIVPRHPSRGDAIARELTSLGFKVAQRSKEQKPVAETDIYLADTLGEMGLFYRLTSIAFIGGSLVDVGGHNPLEAARLDCALLLGPNMYNFEASSSDLLKNNAACQVASDDALATGVMDLLSNDAARVATAKAAKKLATGSTGVATRISTMLLPYLPQDGSYMPANEETP